MKPLEDISEADIVPVALLWTRFRATINIYRRRLGKETPSPRPFLPASCGHAGRPSGAVTTAHDTCPPSRSGRPAGGGIGAGPGPRTGSGSNAAPRWFMCIWLPPRSFRTTFMRTGSSVNCSDSDLNLR